MAKPQILQAFRYFPDASAPIGYIMAARRGRAKQYAHICLDPEETCPVFAVRVLCYKVLGDTNALAGEVLVVRLSGKYDYANVVIEEKIGRTHPREEVRKALCDLAAVLWGGELEPCPPGLLPLAGTVE